MRLKFHSLVIPLLLLILISCEGNRTVIKDSAGSEPPVQDTVAEDQEPYRPVYAMLILPGNPAPGEGFRILATGGRNVGKGKITVSGPPGDKGPLRTKTGEELPSWRLDDFTGCPAGKYTATLTMKNREVNSLAFEIAPRQEISWEGKVWKTTRGWDGAMETMYSAWVNALFQGCDEQTSWSALHEVTQDRERNLLWNYLSLGEDDPASRNHVIMEPDCADNPFFMRAYFAWKLGLPFGYHLCDRGWVGRSPKTGQWVTNESSSPKSDPVLAFNSFVRKMMDGVHSGTARTALDDEHSDYYPVSLDREALRPGTVFADPYGHTLTIISWVPQTRDEPGLLLAVDAQPDNTIAVKRFWKGNFLFNTSEVVGEPGFKAFRPVMIENGKLSLVRNEALASAEGYAAYSVEQRGMGRDEFYRTMERLINAEPLNPEEALEDLVRALHEQLLVRVRSVDNGEAYLRSHPGTVIPMPSGANGIFLAGGPWEDFSTPNRDLRLLIAMDAVLEFPLRVASAPKDYKPFKSGSPEEIRKSLQSLLERKVAELTISYTRSDGSTRELTVAEILSRRDAFEMAYNPNDCIEIRWGAPEDSDERSTCSRRAPPYQQKTMQSVRKWFAQRLHPPT
ncbi:MAG: hypothetical protein PHD25_05390 [Bacteroidales bacterium]|nr:hypothetical protein [Bacteroidales bacterium]